MKFPESPAKLSPRLTNTKTEILPCTTPAKNNKPTQPGCKHHLLLLSRYLLCGWHFWPHVSSGPFSRVSALLAPGPPPSLGSFPLEPWDLLLDISRSSKGSIFRLAVLNLSPASSLLCNRRQNFISYFGPCHCIRENDQSSQTRNY